MLNLKPLIITLIQKSTTQTPYEIALKKILDGWQAGKTGEALELLSIAPFTATKDPLALSLMAILQAELNEKEAATRSLEQAIAVETIDSVSSALLVTALCLVGRFEQAIIISERAMDDDPEHTWIRVMRSIAFLKTGKRESAVESIDAALDIKEDGWTCAWKAEILRQSSRLEEAVKVARRAVYIETDNYFTWAVYGACLTVAGSLDEGKKALSRAIELDPTSAWSYAWRAEAYKLYHDFQAAVDDLKYATSLKPGYHWAWLMLGEALLSTEMYEQALEALDKALGLKPGDWWAWFLKGAACSALEDHRSAVEMLAHALQLNPGYKQAWIRKGYESFILNELEDAYSALSRAVELGADDDEVLELLATIRTIDPKLGSDSNPTY